MTRTCEVWAVGTTKQQRCQDQVEFGHVKHSCIRNRQFAQEHEGEHKCGCGQQWAKQPTDND